MENQVKSIKELQDVHFKQLLTYCKLADKRLGLLVNFNTSDIANSIRRGRIEFLADFLFSHGYHRFHGYGSLARLFRKPVAVSNIKNLCDPCHP